MNLTLTQEKVLTRILWELADDHERAAISSESLDEPGVAPAKSNKPAQPRLPEAEAARNAIRIALANGMTYETITAAITAHPYWTGQKRKDGNWSLQPGTIKLLKNTGYSFDKPTQAWTPYLGLFHCISIVRILRSIHPEIPKFEYTD